MTDLPQYIRRAVNVDISFPRLHELLGLRADARIMNVQYHANLQVVTLTIESPVASLVQPVEEPCSALLHSVQEHRS